MKALHALPNDDTGLRTTREGGWVVERDRERDRERVLTFGSAFRDVVKEVVV